MAKKLTDKSHVLFNSNTRIDMVIYGSHTTNITLSPNQTLNFTFNTGINQYALPVGIYSMDNGVTYNDIFKKSYTTSTENRITIKPAVTLSAAVDSSGVIHFSAVNTTGVTQTVLGKIVLLATDTPSVLPAAALPIGTSSQFAYTSNQGGSYREIIQSGTITGLSNGHIFTTPTNLGKIPIVNAWNFDATINGGQPINQIYTNAVFVDSRWQSFTTGNAYVIAYDNNNIYIQGQASVVNSEYIYRVYRE